MKPVSRGLDRIEVTFDDPGLVADAGLIVVATLVARMGREALIDATVHFTARAAGFKPGRKVLTLVHAMVAGASHIGHADRLRAGAVGRVLGHRVMAPSTLGTLAGVQLRPCAPTGRRRLPEPVPGVGLGYWARRVPPGHRC